MSSDKVEGTTERTIPPPKADPGTAAVDDHTASSGPAGHTQPIDGLDRGVDAEHLGSPSQGARPETTPSD